MKLKYLQEKLASFIKLDEAKQSEEDANEKRDLDRDFF